MTTFQTLNKTPSRPFIAVDYSQRIELDINAKKLDKVRQPDETSFIKTAKKLDKGIIESLKTIAITCLLYVE